MATWRQSAFGDKQTLKMGPYRATVATEKYSTYGGTGKAVISYDVNAVPDNRLVAHAQSSSVINAKKLAEQALERLNKQYKKTGAIAPHWKRGK